MDSRILWGLNVWCIDGWCILARVLNGSVNSEILRSLILGIASGSVLATTSPVGVVLRDAIDHTTKILRGVDNGTAPLPRLVACDL